MGGIVVGVEAVIEPDYEPLSFRRAALMAKKQDAVIVTDTADRFVRHPDYHSVRNPKVRAREFELQELAVYSLGVELITRVDPDAELSKVSSRQTMRGNPGRPKAIRKQSSKGRKSATQDELDRAKPMRAQGISLDGIGRVMSRHRQTVASWEKRGFKRSV